MGDNRKTITIHGDSFGPEGLKIKAWTVTAFFAVHRGLTGIDSLGLPSHNGLWTVTHVLTGYAVYQGALSFKFAKLLALRYAAKTAHLEWNITDAKKIVNDHVFERRDALHTLITELNRELISR